MRVILDAPQPIEKLRKVYNDRVTFITNTQDYPLIREVEIPGNYLSGMRKRLVPVRVRKKVDKLIARYTKRLHRIWDKYQKEIINSISLDGLKKLAPENEVEKADAPTLAQVLSEENPTRRRVLHIKYLKARKDMLIDSRLKEMQQELQRTAKPFFESAYVLGKERGQILTNQEISDDLGDEDKEIIEEKEDWNEEHLLVLLGAIEDDYTAALDMDYDTEAALIAGLRGAHKKQQHRLNSFAGALGAAILATGMAQSIKEIQVVDDTGKPTGEVKSDPDTGEPLGDIFEGGFWHTNQDGLVCPGCEANDGFWMTLNEYQEEINTNQCLSDCRDAELFEPAPRPLDDAEIWQGTPGIDKGVRTFDLVKHLPHGISKHLPGEHDQSTHAPDGGVAVAEPDRKSELIERGKSSEVYGTGKMNRAWLLPKEGAVEIMGLEDHDYVAEHTFKSSLKELFDSGFARKSGELSYEFDFNNPEAVERVQRDINENRSDFDIHTDLIIENSYPAVSRGEDPKAYQVKDLDYRPGKPLTSYMTSEYVVKFVDGKWVKHLQGQHDQQDHAGGRVAREEVAPTATPSGATTAPAERGKAPAPRKIGHITVRYDETDYREDYADRHKIIEEQIEEGLQRIPDDHKGLIEEIIIDDDVLNATTATGSPVFGAEEAVEMSATVMAFVLPREPKIVFNANTTANTFTDKGQFAKWRVGTIIHEVGHKVFDAKVSNRIIALMNEGRKEDADDFKTRWEGLLNEVSPFYEGRKILRGNELSSKARERAAGLYRAYLQHGEKFQSAFPEVYTAVKDEWFDGKEYRRGKLKKLEDPAEPPEIYHYELSNGVVVYTSEPPTEKVVKHLQGQHDQQDHAGGRTGKPEDAEGKLREAGQQLAQTAAQVEHKLTPTIDALAQKTGGMVRGREFRLKTEESIVRKMKAEYLANPNLSPEEVGNEIRDSVRYTLEFSPDTYTDSVKTSLEALEKEGHTAVKVKNYWEQGDPYQGINGTMKSPEGHMWEMQFHTPTSYELKQNALHPLYEQYRVAPDPIARKTLWEQMNTMAAGIAAPVGVAAIGILSRQLMKLLKEMSTRYFAIQPDLANEAISGLIRFSPDEGKVEYYSRNRQWVEDPELLQFIALGVGGAEEINEEKAGQIISEQFSFGEKVKKHLPGQHDQRDHNPHESREGTVSIAEDKPETSTPMKLKTFEGVKSHLAEGVKIIVSAEKDNIRPEENRVRSIGLKRILNNYSPDVVMQQGRWGGTSERSYVATIPEESVAELQQLAFTELKQQAVVVIRNGEAELSYADGKKEYGRIADLTDARGDEDNYSKLGEVKYRIDFKEKK